MAYTVLGDDHLIRGGGGGGLALFGNKYSDLKMLEINKLSPSAKKINNLT